MSVDLRYENVTPDQRELAEISAKYFAKAVDDPRGGAELGWFGIGTDPDAGGAGGTTLDLALVLEAGGANLAASCVGEVALVAAPMLLGSTPEDVMRRMLDGELVLGLPAASPWQVAVGAAGATGATGATGANGLPEEVVVLGAETCDVLLVPAQDGVGGQQLLLVDARHESVSRLPLASADPSRHLAQYGLAHASTDVILARATGDDLFTEFMARRAALAALDAIGTARAAFDKTLAYAAVRTQFDRPIGSFQAYKHRCADAFIELKLGQSIAFGAARTAGTPQGNLLGLAAGRCATANATFICGESVQLHGGIGFTWEAGLHAHLKRARMDEIIGRGCPQARARLLALDDRASDRTMHL